MRAIVTFVILTLCVLACDDFVVRPTELTLTVNMTELATGEVVQLRYDAQGASLSRLILSYGDATPLDTLLFQGAVTATGNREHAYTDAGQFLITGTLEEFNGESVDREIVMTITDP